MDTYQKIIAAVVLIIAGLASGIFFGRLFEGGEMFGGNAGGPPQENSAGASSPDSAGASGTGNAAVLADGNAIAVNDQAPGLSVAVRMAAFVRDGWVVVHENDGGKPGRILGAKRFSSGQGQSGVVELLRPTAEGNVYFAMLHDDDGDRQFDHIKDLPLRDPQGNMIFMRFVATANSPVE